MRTRTLLVALLALAALVVTGWVLTNFGERAASAVPAGHVEPFRAPATTRTLDSSGPESTAMEPPAPRASERTALSNGLGDLEVRVVQRAGGRPLADVPLRLQGAEPNSIRESSSDADGRCRFVDLQPGDYTLEPTADGDRDYAADPTPVAIAADTAQAIVLPVEPRWFLAGTVVAPGSARPVAGVGLAARDPQGSISRLATSSADGRFHSRRSFPAGELSVCLSERETEGLMRTHGNGPDLLQVAVGREDVSHLTVELTWTGVLRGLVVGPRDAPIPDAELRVLTGDSIYLGNASLRFWSVYENMRDRGRSTRSDSQGRFAFDRLPDDRTLVVVASAPGFVSSRSADLSPPFLPDDPPVVLPLEQAGAVAGTVRDTDGQLLGEITVTALSAQADYQPDPTRTDEQGAFRLDGLTPGATEVTALAFDEGRMRYPLASGTVEVIAGQVARLDLRASADGIHVTGSAVDQEGERITADRARLHVRTRPLEPRPGEQAWGFDTPLEDDGTFDVTVARAVHYELTLLDDAAGTLWESVEVRAPARDVRVPFTVVPTGVLAIHALDAETGEPIQQGQISISWEHGSQGMNFLAGGGKTRVREGLYTVTVDARGYAPVTRSLDLRSGLQPQTTVELRLDHGHPVAGLVRDAEGLPVQGSTVVLLYGGQLQLENLVYSDVDGRFTIPTAPASGGSVCVVDAAYRLLATAEIGPGEVVLTIDAR